MAAITGFGEFSISPMISGRLGGCDGLLNSVMSAPAMKVRPAPTSTIARVAASSRACVSVLNRPARTTCLSALTGGLSTVMTAISPSFCKPTSVVTGSHPPRWCDSDRRSAELVIVLAHEAAIIRAKLPIPLPVMPLIGAASFDHLVGDGEYIGRNFEAERLSGFEVEDQLELGGLLHREIGRHRAS